MSFLIFLVVLSIFTYFFCKNNIFVICFELKLIIITLQSYFKPSLFSVVQKEVSAPTNFKMQFQDIWKITSPKHVNMRDYSVQDPKSKCLGTITSY